MSKKLFYERRWLNRRHGRAFTIATMENYGHGYNDVFLEIGDCSQTVTLDFCFADDAKKSEKQKQLTKLDKFIETCQKLRAAMHERMENPPPKKKEKKK